MRVCLCGMYEVDEETGCWNFNGAKDRKGYGKLGAMNRQWYAHRFSWFLQNGEIPEHGVILHLCHNASCVNPDHLQLGSSTDNLLDEMARRRAAAGLSTA